MRAIELTCYNSNMNLTFQRIGAFFFGRCCGVGATRSFLLYFRHCLLGFFFFFNTELIMSCKWHLLTSGRTFRSTTPTVPCIFGKNHCPSFSSSENNKIELFKFFLIGKKNPLKSVWGGTSANLVYSPFSASSEVFLNEVQKVSESRGKGGKLSSVHTHTHKMETLVSNINKRWVVTPKLFFFFFLTASGGSDEFVKLSNFPLF